MTNLLGLASLTEVGYDLTVQSNPLLSSLTGLDSLNTIGGNLLIHNNDSMTNLLGLGSLTEVGNDFAIQSNPALSNFTGLDSLNTIWGNLRIWFNTSLTDISAIENLAYIGSALTIQYNFDLSECDVQSICSYIADPNGTILIWNNSPGCNSQEEVEEACLTSINETIPAILAIQPNPAIDFITVSVPGSKGWLQVYNVNGKKVMEQQLKNSETKLNIIALPPGVYVVRLQDEKEVAVAKFVKE
jgi:hypothetical protein